MLPGAQIWGCRGAVYAANILVAVLWLLQLHHPYSLLRIALFDKDTTEAAVGADELLGALDFQLHLLMPQRIYDIA